MNILIFEDEIAHAEYLLLLIKKHFKNWHILGVGKSILECKELLNKYNDCDIIFSDIHFDSENIFETLPELHGFKGNIIFVSGDNNFASQAFEMSAVDYLLKPFNENSFLRVAYKLENLEAVNNLNSLKVLSNNLLEKLDINKKISFYTNDGFIVKNVSEIIYFKADNNYTEVFCLINEKIVVSKTILYFEKLLEFAGFFRVHQSYLINMNFIKIFKKSENIIIMNDGSSILLSLRRKSAFIEKMETVF